MEQAIADRSAPRPVLVHDARDELCARWVARWRVITGEAVEYLSIDEARARYPDVDEAELARAVRYVESAPGQADEVTTGARAVFRALSTARDRRWLLASYERFAGLAVLADATYAFASTHRRAALALTTLLIGRDARPVTHLLTRWLLLRLLGVCALAAFLSIWSQIDGLLGDQGITPATELIERVRAIALEQHLGAGQYQALPTLFWLHPTEGFLHVLCGAGVVASLLLIVNVLPGPATLCAWACYLSILSVAREWLHFQWDLLLLESLLTALFLAPFRLRPKLLERSPPSRTALWLLRLLLFKLMFLSGAVKLLSHDRTWSSLDALAYHYWTQPLPAWTSWYAQRLPTAVQHLCVLVMFVIELGAPFLIFGTRRIRRLGAWSMMLLQAAIAATGNYGFFNLLAFALCVVLLDDGALRRFFPRKMRLEAPSAFRTAKRHPLARLASYAAAAALAMVSGSYVLHAFKGGSLVPGAIDDLAELVAPLHSVNGYGLFRTMTVDRPEVVIEGSDDGVTWKPYELPWKVGEVDRASRFTGLHMPRLDWELWFAALYGRCEDVEWYPPFILRLLQGSPSVIALLAGDPFAGRAPSMIRSRLFEYAPASSDEHARTGAFWTRRELRPFCPTLALEGGELVVVPEPAALP